MEQATELKSTVSSFICTLHTAMTHVGEVVELQSLALKYWIQEPHIKVLDPGASH